MNRTPNVYCPGCSVDGNANHPNDCIPDYDLREPVHSAMGVLFVEQGKSVTHPAAHFTYVCPRCGYGEIHERLIA